MLSSLIGHLDGLDHCRLLAALGFLTTDEPASFCIATALFAANNLFYSPLRLPFCEFAAFGWVLNGSFSSHSYHLFELCFKQLSVGLNGGTIYPFAVRWISGKTNAVDMDSDDPAPPNLQGLLSSFIRPRDGLNHRRIFPAFGFLAADKPSRCCVATNLNGRYTMIRRRLAAAVFAVNDLPYGSFNFASFELTFFGWILDYSWSCHVITSLDNVLIIVRLGC